MPYFQRKPIEGLVDSLRSQIQIPGLPSRGPALPAALTAGVRPDSPLAGITGIVEQATAVLASERPSASPMPSSGSYAGSATSTQSTQVSQLQQQVNTLIEQVVTLVSQPPGSAPAAQPSTGLAAGGTSSDIAGPTIEAAPVLAPPGPVMPGSTAQIKIPLINEDEQPVQIVFLSTDLIGDAGDRIPAERVSFQPPELSLQAGDAGEVVVRALVSAQTRAGVYSGLVRASRLEYLHAVVVVQVEE